jgi:hypothetical protein
MTMSGVKAAQTVGFGDALDRQRGRGSAQGAPVALGAVTEVIPGSDHASAQAFFNVFPAPPVGLVALDRPFEVADQDTAGVGEDVGDDGDPVGLQDLVGLRGGGAVSSLHDQGGAHAARIGGGEHAFDGGGDDDGRVEFKELVGREGVGTGEAGNGPGGVDVPGQGVDVDAASVGDGSVLVADRDDLEAGVGEEDGGVASDLAESLDRGGGRAGRDAQALQGLERDVA